MEWLRDRSVRVAAGIAIAVAIPGAVLFYFQFRSLSDLGRSSAVVLQQLSHESNDKVTTSLTDTLSADLRDAMRAGDQVRRDEIRGLLAALQAERQAKLTRALSKQGLIVHGDDATLKPEQQAAV